MLTRNPDNIEVRSGIEVIEGNVLSRDSIIELINGCHTVINTLGQPVKKVPIYNQTTTSILEVMKEYGVRRYIGVTGGSLNVSGDQKSLINKAGAKLFELFLREMMIDKQNELRTLENSKLDWTLVRLPFVKEGPGTGYVKEDLRDMPGVKIENMDIARFIINQVKDKKYVRSTPFISN